MAVKSIQVRIEDTLKSRVEKIFSELGMDTSTAIRLFFRQVEQTNSIPFPLELRDENGFTEQENREIDEAVAESYREEDTFGPFSSAEEMIASLHKESAKLEAADK